MYLNPFAGYQLYLASKLHFSSDTYDMMKEGGRVNVTEAAFEKKTGVKYAIMRLVKKYPLNEFVPYVIANVLAGDKQGGLFGTEGEERYTAWKKRMQSLSYTYKQDLIRLKEAEIKGLPSPLLNVKPYTLLWFPVNGQHPLILREYLAQNICLETLVILDILYKYSENLDTTLSYDPTWKATSKLIKKYTPFVEIAASDFSLITEDVFE